MRKLTYYVALSIDGFIAAPDGSFDAFPIEGPHMQTIAAEFPETLPFHLREFFGLAPDVANKRFDTILMGRKTHDPAVAAGLTNAYPHLRTYVFSRTLQVDDPTVTVVAGDAVATVRALKSESGRGIWLCGGGSLAGQLLPEIDELIVKSYPIVLGSGIPMFTGPYAPRQFDLAESVPHANGVVFQHYRPTS